MTQKLFLVGLAALALAGAGLVIPMVWSQEEPPGDQPPAGGGSPRTGRFAEDRAPEPPPKAPPFDAKRAMGYLKQLCDLGPRVSGSAGMTKQQELLKAHFTKLGGTVTFQRFEAKQVSKPAKVPMANLVVTWHPERAKRVLLCGHYDTRPIADMEPDRRDWFKPFASANDGTTTTAWLMELAHHIKAMPLDVGVDFAFFDGEEYVYDNRTAGNGGDRYFFGSEHFAKEYRQSLRAGRLRHRYIAGVLLDLFAGENPTYYVEPNSYTNAAAVVKSIWGTAEQLGEGRFVYRFMDREVRDDHIMLNRYGLPTVDIIDMSYEHWHLLSDTPENCSGESMSRVARVLTVWLQQL